MVQGKHHAEVCVQDAHEVAESVPRVESCEGREVGDDEGHDQEEGPEADGSCAVQRRKG